jgi:hypothetical protein
MMVRAASGLPDFGASPSYRLISINDLHRATIGTFCAAIRHGDVESKRVNARIARFLRGG